MLTISRMTPTTTPNWNEKKILIEGECLSTDDKPTDYANGSILFEMDTATMYMYDEAGESWRPWT